MAPEGVRVVSGLHTLSAVTLGDLGHPLDEDVLLCGDRREDKERVGTLIGKIDGLRVVDCGRLEMARIAESLTALLIAVNARYKSHAGLRVTGLPGQ
jgi:NADPH-dependent F420 reductase